MSAAFPRFTAQRKPLHSFTQSLRIQLRNTGITVFELAPPGTETPSFRSDFGAEDLQGVKAMDVKTLARRAIAGMEKDIPAIRPGLADVLKLMRRIAPEFMLRQISKSADRMSARSGASPR